MNDPYDLDRFVVAQSPVFGRVLDELRAGRKRSHWMWFVFPQIAGLGSSPMARRYAVASLGEARAYLDHPVLGPRLKKATAIVDGLAETSATTVFGVLDDLKFRSCLTLFDRAAADEEDVFRRALDHFFGGTPDPATVERLR